MTQSPLITPAITPPIAIAPQRTAILILGMHRSGTSAIARVLNLLGGTLPANLMPPAAENNETGFWESLDVAAFNDELLQSAGSRWDDWQPINPAWFAAARTNAFYTRASTLITTAFADTQLIVLKDPRLCRLLPFWLAVFAAHGFAVKLLLPLRNPLAVAASLRKRDQFPLPKSALLWLAYVLDAELFSRQQQRAVFIYDDLLADWRGVVRRASDHLALAWPRWSATAEADIDAFLRPQLQHHQFDAAAVATHPELAAWVKRTFAALTTLLTPAADTAAATAELDAVRGEFDQARAALGAVLRAEELAHAAAQQSAWEAHRLAGEAETRAIMAAAAEAAANARAQAEVAAAETRAQAAADQLQAAVAAAETRAVTATVATTQSVLDDLRQQIAAADQRRVATAAQLTTTLAEMQAAQQRQWQLEQSLRDERHQVTALQLTRRQQRQQLQQLERALPAWQQQVTTLAAQLTQSPRPAALSDDVTMLTAQLAQERHTQRQHQLTIAQLQQQLAHLTPRQQQLLQHWLQLRHSHVWPLVRALLALEQRLPRRLRRLLQLPTALGWLVRFRLRQVLRQRRTARQITATGLFDAAWYAARYPAIVTSGSHPLAHWLAHGWRGGFDPHPLFAADWYRAQLPADAQHLDPLLHYVQHGAAAGYDPHPLFATRWYLTTQPEVAAAGVNPLQHFVAHGGREGRAPHPLFDAAWYLATQPDVAAAGINPLIHFLFTGAAEGRNPHPLFLTRYYCERYPDVISADSNPLIHFVLHGAAEGRQPHPLFDPALYCNQWPPITAVDGNPLVHFLFTGAAAGRHPHALFDTQWYVTHYPTSAAAHRNPLAAFVLTGLARGDYSHPLCDWAWYSAHYAITTDPVLTYCSWGWQHRHSLHPLFDAAWYAEQYPASAAADRDPFIYYLTTGAAQHEQPHPLFAVDYYLAQVTIERAAAVQHPLRHYLEYGSQQGYQPHPLFAGQWYCAHYPDVAASGINPLVHFVLTGAAEGRNPHPLFDAAWYRQQVPDRAVNENPLVHYLRWGARYHYAPHPLFDAAWYRAQYLSPVAFTDSAVIPLVHYITHGAAAGHHPHPLFHSAWYCQQYPDVAAAPLTPLAHYIEYGAAAGRNPHPLFDAAWYVSQQPELTAIDLNPLQHYLMIGAAAGRDPHPLFNSAWYLEHSPDLAAAGINPLVHFITAGAFERRSPHPLFDVEWYAAQEPWLLAQRVNPLEHYLYTGGFNGGTPHPLFDSAWYLAQDAELTAAQVNPLVHYVRWGAWEGRDPHPLFQTTRYLDRDPDLRAAQLNPLVHYLLWGGFEGRDPHPLFDSDWYLEQNPTLLDGDLNPLVHYLRWGATEQRNPHPLFHTAWYRERYYQLLAVNMNPLVHYVRWGAFAGCNPNPQFNSAWYLAQDAELTAALVNPLVHYLEHGAAEGRNPSEQFHSHWYQQQYADVATAGLNPLVHYVLFGATAGYLTRAAEITVTAPSAHADLYAQLLYTAEHHTDHHDYVAADDDCLDANTLPLKLIAFYLPQFHPIPENDRWWGTGFTEWTNVTKAVPQYEGHYQPRLPDTLGFYDLRVSETQREQIRLARQHGIYGFCYYYYWFDGHQLLERPLLQVLNDPTLDLPFCLCWANENWTRRWDGGDETILMGQRHCPADDLAFIAAIAPVLMDQRYIRVAQRPLLLVYRPQLLPTPAATAARWRDWMRTQHQVELFLVAVQSFEGIDPTTIDFDAASEFPPHQVPSPEITARFQLLNPQFSGRIYDYEYCVNDAERKYEHAAPTDYVTLPGVMVNWDNTARRLGQATIFANATPPAYQRWLHITCQRAMAIDSPAQRIAFVNAWNEWAEGSYLEPDRRYGFRYLQITRAILARFTPAAVNWATADIELNQRAISVIIPVYNGAAWLTAALDSIAQQTLAPHEIVIVNDGSTDQSHEIIHAWRTRHPEIIMQCITQENRGAPAAINYGVALCRTPFIAVLNQDDVFHPQRLEQLFAALQHPLRQFVFSKVEVLNSNAVAAMAFARRLHQMYATLATRPSLLHALLTDNLTVSTGNHAFTQALFMKIGGYKALHYCHDWDFALSAFLHTEPLFIKTALYHYRIHDTNTFQQLGDQAEDDSRRVLSAFYQQLTAQPALLTRYFGTAQQLEQYAQSVGHTQLLGGAVLTV